MTVKSFSRTCTNVLTGYLFAQYPAGYLMQRLPVAKVIGASTLGITPRPLLKSSP